MDQAAVHMNFDDASCCTEVREAALFILVFSVWLRSSCADEARMKEIPASLCLIAAYRHETHHGSHQHQLFWPVLLVLTWLCKSHGHQPFIVTFIS